MIFYFSGAGNSRHVAERLSAATGETLLPIDRCLREGKLHASLAQGESLGFVFPTHFWGLPAIVHEFIRRFSVTRAEEGNVPVYVYGVATYGTSVGAALSQLKRALAARGLRLTARFALRMVDTWTPLFDLTDTAKNLRRTRKAEAALNRIAADVCARKSGPFLPTALPVWLGCLQYAGYGGRRRTRHFHVIAERCTACHLCMRECPVQAIGCDEAGRPVWHKEQCTLCLRCLHRCPAFAIQYGRHTERHGQFTYPHALPAK